MSAFGNLSRRQFAVHTQSMRGLRTEQVGPFASKAEASAHAEAHPPALGYSKVVDKFKPGRKDIPVVSPEENHQQSLPLSQRDQAHKDAYRAKYGTDGRA